MDTSGTGHDRCPSQSFPTRQAPGTPPLGGNEKIKNTVLVSRGEGEKFQCPTDPATSPGALPIGHFDKGQCRIVHTGAAWLRCRSYLKEREIMANETKPPSPGKRSHRFQRRTLGGRLRRCARKSTDCSKISPAMISGAAFPLARRHREEYGEAVRGRAAVDVSESDKAYEITAELPAWTRRTSR